VHRAVSSFITSLDQEVVEDLMTWTDVVRWSKRNERMNQDLARYKLTIERARMGLRRVGYLVGEWREVAARSQASLVCGCVVHQPVSFLGSGVLRCLKGA
jgi:hypothetical protein